MAARNKAYSDGTTDDAEGVWFDSNWPDLLVEPAESGAVRLQQGQHQIEIPCNARAVVKKTIENVVRVEESRDEEES